VIGSLCTKAFLASQLFELIEEFPFLSEQEVQLPQPSKKKDKFIEAVIKAHRLLTAQDPDFRKKVKQLLSAQSILCNGFADQRRKRQELKRPFYSMPQAAKDGFYENKYVIHYIEDVAETVEQGEPNETARQEHSQNLDVPSRTPERAPRGESESDTPFVQRQFGKMSFFSP
jgi:hypothetical protein